MISINPSFIKQFEQLIIDVACIKNNMKNEKTWLSTRELSHYIDYSQDRIHKLKNEEFIEGIHYYKKSGKLLFDKYKIDEWVCSSSQTQLTQDIVQDLIHNITKDTMQMPEVLLDERSEIE